MKIVHVALLSAVAALAPLVPLVPLAPIVPIAPHAVQAVDGGARDEVDAAIDLQREENERTFREGYLPHKAALFERHAGQWLVIVGGLVVPALDGYPMPTTDLAAALAEADVYRPDALQRFVFRVGEEGEVVQHPSASERPDLAGVLLTSYFGADFWVTPDGTDLAPSGAEPESGVRIGSGLSDERGPHMTLTVGAPGGGAETSVELQFAAGYSGHTMFSKATARRVGLHRFEIPGGVTLHPLQKQLRRARAHFRLAGSELDAALPVALKSI